LNEQDKRTPVELASGLQIKLDPGVVKDALKEGVREWIDDKYREVGKYTTRAIGVALFGALIYFLLWAGGWHSPLTK
jgi:hypothetical protein